MSDRWLARAWARLRPAPSTRPDDAGAGGARPDWDRVAAVLAEAVDLPTAEREAFLARACAAEPELGREVRSLLAEHEKPGLLDRPAAEIVRPLLTGPSLSLPVRGGTVAQYEIVDQLGSGGMGVVYRARDLRLGRWVALKFLPPHLSQDPVAKERLLVEARAAAALDHPHICTVHDVGETEEGQLFLAMTCYAGETLQQRLSRGAVGVGTAIEIGIQTAYALQHAHERGVVHRDVKPANLMLSESAQPAAGAVADVSVKVLDFGIAKRADVDLTAPGRTPGTAAYMSPEQASGGVVDHRTDLWSLGVVLYEMLAGRRPFRSPDEAALREAILQAEPEPLGAVRPGLPPALLAAIDRTLHRRPEQRPPDAHALALELDQARAELADATASGVVIPAPQRHRGAERAELLAGGERRQATVLAATLGGYAELVERMAPDELDAEMARLHTIVAELAERQVATVDRFTGESIVLVFGLPLAHEDDSVRAVRAAQELLDRTGSLSAELGRRTGAEHRLCIGIEAGRVVAQPTGGTGGRVRIVGAAAHLAPWLAASADAGEVWVGPECQRLIGAFYETEALPALPPRERGGTPLTPFVVRGGSGVETRLEAAARAGLTTFVGRAGELEALEANLDSAVRGAGTVVAVTGEAGMGKSRLLYEFRQRLDPDRVTVLRGRCPSHGGVSYLPFIEILRDCLAPRAAGATQRDSRATVAARIRAIGEELEEFIPLYLHLLALPGEEYPVPKHLHGDQYRLAMQDALAAILTLQARPRPTVLLLEDWHWADAASRAVMRQVVEMTPDYALLVVVTYRPGPTAELTDPEVVTVRLRPLEPEASRTMLRAAIGADEVPAELARLVHERAGGNPFFVEEIAHALLEEGAIALEHGRVELRGSVEALDLPDTVQAVIRARIDRLERGAREVLRLASVVGREFDRGVVEQCLDEAEGLPAALDTLKSAGLIQQMRVVPGAAYRFKHVLTQEVAYASLLERQRTELHGRVARAIESLHDARLEEHLDRLAYHFSRADRWLEAVRYGIGSAQRAGELSQFDEARQILERVQGWISRLPEGPERRELACRALLHQERICESLGERGQQQRIIDRLVELLEPGADPAALAEVYVRQGDLFTLLRRFDDAEAVLNRALALNRERGDRVGERNALRSLGLLRWHAGDHAESLRCIEAALRISQERDDLEALLGELANMGNVLKAMGEYDRAQQCLERALSLAESLEQRVSTAVSVFKQCYILHNLANIHRERGDNQRALGFLRRAVELTEGMRLPIQLSYHYTAIAHILLQEGKVEESLAHYRRSVELERRAQYASGLSQALRILGEVLLGLGRAEEALPCLEEAAGLFARLQDHDTEALLWRRIAGAQERAGNDTAALAAWSRARALHRRAGDGAGELRALEGLASVTRRHVAEPSLALGHYREALALAASLGDASAQARLCNTIGILEWTQGNLEEALDAYERALELFRGLDDGRNVGLAMNSLAVTLRSLGRPDQARQWLDRALQHHREADQPLLEGHALAVLGDMHRDAGDAARAVESYARSLELRRDAGDRLGEGWMLHNLARTQLERGLAGAARQPLEAAETIAAELDDTELRTAVERLRADAAL